MAMSVTVLCPNGRRVNVKVTPNTSILQIIEDACKKEQFDPDEYDLKHLQRILDTSSTVRYANIPNKSQLELIKSAVPRKASSVTVNIATDSGLRLVHDFPADTTLWEILEHHEHKGNEGQLIPPEEGENEAVIVYTMRRINGNQMKTTTLKSLGLTGGKCMLRHSIQKSSSSGQAHVAAPLTRPKTSKEDNDTQNHRVVNNASLQDSIQRPAQLENHISSPSVRPQQPQEQRQQVPQPASQRGVQSPQQAHHCPDVNMHSFDVPPLDILERKRPDVITSTQDKIPDIIQPQKDLLQPDVVADKLDHSHQPAPMDILEGHEGASAFCYSAEDESESMEVEEKVIKLGSHDAILFSMDDAPSTRISDEDDSFFQLTVDEVRSMYREQQQTLRSLENAPLMTKQMRDMEESAKVLSAMNQYPITQLRIYFPDNNVLQGIFKPTETIADVMIFLKQYLADPSVNFSLSLRHPPKVLTTEMTLVEADCIPNARLYYSSSSSPYLSEDTLAKKSSFKSANNTLKRRQRREMSSFTCREESTAGSSSQALASNSSGEASYHKRTTASTPATGAVQKVPKWFKTGK